jgi:hypothetical protein
MIAFVEAMLRGIVKVPPSSSAFWYLMSRRPGFFS